MNSKEEQATKKRHSTIFVTSKVAIGLPEEKAHLLPLKQRKPTVYSTQENIIVSGFSDKEQEKFSNNLKEIRDSSCRKEAPELLPPSNKVVDTTILGILKSLKINL